MKKLNLTRIIVLVLSIALLIGSAVAITAAADETAAKGEFGGISLAYGEKVAIRVAVKATEAEINNGDVVVSYTVGGTTANATYKEAGENGYVWVMTEGIAAYALGEKVTFSSTAGGKTVESDRTYSVAQFLYTMLYTNSGISAEYKTLYNALLTYGEAAQVALKVNTDKLVTSSTLVYTENAEIALNGGSLVFAPASGVEVSPTYNGTTPVGSTLEGWMIEEGGEEKAVGLSFSANGVVKVLSPVFAEIDPTPYILANGGFENGLEGWTLVGNIGNVSSATNYWSGDPESAEGFAFGMDGEKMFSAYEGGIEAAVGTLTSSTFTVGGSGFVTFKLGAMRDGNYVYVDVVDAESKQILARYYNGLWAERNAEGVKSGCTLVAYKADLSAFAGKKVFFRLSDNADSGYGLFFADSFNTYYVTEPEGFNAATPVGYGVSGTIYDVFNGGFETGDNRGWWNVGEPGAVTGADAFFNGVAYGKEGNFLYSGVEDHGAGNGREVNVGVLTSSVFELGGNGYITYMLGGGNAFCYVQVIDSTTGEILARFRQQAREDAVLKHYVADLSAYIGRSVRVQVVDNATGDWGCVSFDGLVTYHTTVPEGITAIDVKYELVNGSFEEGMNGWKELGADLGEVISNEIGDGWYTKNDGNKDGNNIFSFAYFNADGGVVNTESNRGTLESSRFVLKKGSYVAFRFGGAGGADGQPLVNTDVYIELCRADGSVIATFYNDAEGKVNTKMNAFAYLYEGEDTDCFFRVVDNSIGNYGCFVVDDFRVNLEAKPEGFEDAAQ